MVVDVWEGCLKQVDKDEQRVGVECTQQMGDGVMREMWVCELVGMMNEERDADYGGTHSPYQ